MTEKVIVIIDAGFLSKLSKYYGSGKYLKYDIIQLSKNISKKQNLHCEKIFYYTSPPFQSERSTAEEKDRYKGYKKFKEKLSKHPLITLREGRCQRLKIDGNFEYKQKGVDALAIIDMMSVPIEYPEVKTIILIANDSDFVPVVEKLKSLGIKIILLTYYSKNRRSSFSKSNELLKSVSEYFELTKEDFDSSPISI